MANVSMPAQLLGVSGRNAGVRSVYVRALGAVYLAAFTSLGAQVRGLYGRRGILPIAEVLDSVRPLGKRRFGVLPTLFWLDATDETLVRACRAGQLLAIALMLGAAPRPVLALLWALYLSFVAVGSEFLSYQWDVLLLETSVHAFVTAPSGLILRSDEEPPWHAVLLLRWLAARFYYEAGIAKLRYGDETWRARTACAYHYETQPLPTPLAWHAHRLPLSWHRRATSAALAIECLGPFFAFGRPRERLFGFVALAGLQVLIAATGNYGFFNLLAITVALPLLDDDLLRLKQRPRATTGRVRRWVMAACEGALFLAGVGAHLARFGKRPTPRWLDRLTDALSSLRSMSAYGLFANMTTQRLEIELEGSNDLRQWSAYTFRYKPGPPARRPRFVAPHQPRLDWQMWFAALQRPPSWFYRLMQRVLEGSTDVLALFERVPFAEPPRYLRAAIYDQHMTDRATRARTGDWYRRELLGLYAPPMMLGAGSEPVTGSSDDGDATPRARRPTAARDRASSRRFPASRSRSRRRRRRPRPCR